MKNRSRHREYFFLLIEIFGLMWCVLGLGFGVVFFVFFFLVLCYKL